MFSQLANYLLGTTSNEHPEGTASGVEETRLTSILSEDDWVLVDRDSEGNSEISSVESLDECSDGEDVADDFDRAHALTSILTRSSSTSSLPCNTMEESWYITPPPCFTSAGPIVVETSPLENLLIEHPSMSVYQHSQPIYVARRHNSAPLQPVTDLIMDDNAVTEAAQRADEEEVQVVTAARVQVPRRTRVEIIQQQQIIRKKHAQKVQIQRACRSLKRGYLERNNKAREVNCRNQRQRRGERSQGARRSYANNNRKC